MTTGHRTLVAGAYAVPALVFLAVYVPAAGHGYVSDDFGWILHNRLRGLADVWRIALNDNGFYRPAVACSFGLNELAFGLDARGYGQTNVALAVLCGAAIYLLSRALTLPRGGAALAAALWLLNFHGVNMAILWISGRTALMATVAATGCAAALLRGRTALAALLLAVAVASREDAALLPAVTVAWLYVLRRANVPIARRAHLSRWVLSSGAVVAVYFLIRSTTDAMTPATAPAYYRVTIDPGTLARNAVEYADRTMTTALGAMLILGAVFRPGRPLLDPATRAIAACGGVWLAAFLAPAVVLPVRSSLYACLPAVGVCIAAAAVATRWWSLAAPQRRRMALACAILLPLILWPAYHARTERWVALAEFSARALSDLDAATRGLPDDSNILIVDDRGPRANVASAFSTLLREAFLLTTARFMNFYVTPPIPNAPEAGGGRECQKCESVRLVVRNGRLEVVR